MSHSNAKKSIIKKVIALIAVCLLVTVVTLGASFWYGVSHPESLFASDGSVVGYIKLLISDQKALDEIITVDPNDDQYLRRLSMLEANADYSYMAGKTNILLLGIDENQERADWGYYRTDTIIVLNIDFENNTASMLSIPRDSLVWIKGYGGKARVNKAFGEGGGYKGHGFENVMDTVSDMLGGVQIDSYVCVDMEVLKTIVDAIGGVDYYVDHAVSTSDATLSVGQQHLWGAEVLAYVRQRKGDSDIARVDRQQRMLAAIFTQLKASKKLVLIPQLYSAVKDQMYTDLSVAQISALARWAMDFDIENLKRDTVPGEGLYIGDGSYWAINQYKLEDIIADFYGLSVTLSKSNDVSAIKPAAERFNYWRAIALEQGTTTGAYIYANRGQCVGDEYSTYINMLSNLTTLANTESLTDPGGKADEIKAAVTAFQSYCSSLESTLRNRISGGSTTPTDPPAETTEPEPTAPPVVTDPGDSGGETTDPTPAPSV